MPFFLPALAWWGIGAVATLGATAVVLHEADDLAESAVEPIRETNSLLTTTAIVAVGYLAYKHRRDIKNFLSK